MKKEKVRIKVRLTKEEKEKLERNSALCGLTQSEYVRQLCRMFTRSQNRRMYSGS